MSALSTWEHRVDAFESDDWVIVELGIDLKEAVTLVASATATIAGGVDFHDPPPHRFGYALNWLLQDTLTGADWYRLAGGRLVFNDAQQISRISSPPGTAARLCLKPQVVADMDRAGLQQEDAAGYSHLWRDKGLVRPANARITVAVRSL